MYPALEGAEAEAAEAALKTAAENAAAGIAARSDRPKKVARRMEGEGPSFRAG